MSLAHKAAVVPGAAAESGAPPRWRSAVRGPGCCWCADALESFGSLDVLSATRASKGPVAPLAEYPEDGFDEVVAVNLRGVLPTTPPSTRSSG